MSGPGISKTAGSLEPDSRLGFYEVRALLGAGGMGEVYRARDSRLGRDVALKVLPKELAADSDRLTRFEREARAASSLNHPNIITIYEIGTADSVSFIAMELVSGRTLREEMEAGPLPSKRILALASQVADGIAKAHAAGIVHRDLKPENVMVSTDGFVKILDFGLAKLTRPVETGVDGTRAATVSARTEAGIVMGTVSYMSPEQARGEVVDFRSDQFSFGSMLYEMATGKRAFSKQTRSETLAAILRDEPEPIAPLNPRIPAPLHWIVERCLAKEPEHRYASTEDLAKDLASLRDRRSEATAVAEASGPPRPSRRFAVWRITALAAALVAVAALAMLVRQAGRNGSTSPSFHRLTFRRGVLGNACFAPDGQTIVFSANWAGELRHIYSTRTNSPESRQLDLGTADILGISSAGEMGVVLYGAGPRIGPSTGTLARVSLAGGAPREVLEGVNLMSADWSADGKGFAVVRSRDGKNRLELPIGNVLLETTAPLSQIRVSPGGDRVAFWEGGSLAVVEASGRGKRILSSGLENDNGGIPSWTADGREIWFSASEPGHPPALFATNLSGQRRLVARVPGGLELHALSRDGRVLLAHYTMVNSVLGVAPGETQERDVSWLDGSSVNDLSADGRRILMTETLEGGGPERSIYLRGTDGGPAKRLGDGLGMTLSPDGKWAIASIAPAAGAATRLVLLPTGAGEPRTLEYRTFEAIEFANWLPDGKKILLAAKEPGRRRRLYVQDLAAGEPRAVAPEGVGIRRFGNSVSPDGKSVLGVVDGKYMIYPLDEGSPRPIRGIESGDAASQWTADGRALYVLRRQGATPAVWLLDLVTGQRRLFKEMHPPDPVSTRITQMLLTPGGESYVYQANRVLSELYLVDGLK